MGPIKEALRDKFFREKRPESPLRDGQRGGDAGPPWGIGAKGEKRRPAGLGKIRTFGSGGRLWDP